MQNLRPLLALMLPYWKHLTVGILAMFVTTACMLTLPRYLKNIFDTALLQQDLSALHNVIFLASGLVIILVIGVFLRTYFIQYPASCMINDLRRTLFTHTLNLDLSTFETRAGGEIISRLLSDVTVMREFVQTALPMLIRGVLLTVGTLTALMLLNWQLTLYLALAIVPVAVVAGVLGKKWRRYSRDIQSNFAQLSDRTEEIIAAIKTVKTSAQEIRETKNIHTFMDNALGIAKKLITSWAGFASFNIFIGFIAVLSVLYLGGREVILGHMSVGSMLAYLLYLAFLGDGASNVANFWPALNNVLGATERVFELLKEDPKILETSTPQQLPQNPTNTRKLALKGVSFTYPSRPDTSAISALNLTVNAGETIAIVGPSGAGKSTLFSLLLRLYEADTGRIELDDINIKNLTFQNLRTAFATVNQDTHIFAGTVQDNIAYATPHAAQKDIVAAAKQANAHDFIDALPEGYNTQVGAKGVRLSGGQKQRLAIARAILQDAPILLLDEATSHLDAQSERAVQTALDSLQQNRTVLVIAHRLATVKNADRIIVLNEGKITAEGTHTQLLKTSPLYKKLATLQFITE